MSVGTIGASSGATEALPAGAKSKVATVACAGYKAIPGTFSPGQYILKGEAGVTLYDNGNRVAQASTGEGTVFNITTATSNLSVELDKPDFEPYNQVSSTGSSAHNAVMNWMSEKDIKRAYTIDSLKAIYTVGNGRYFYKTTDGGKTFTKKDLANAALIGSATYASYSGAAVTDNGSHVYITGRNNDPLNVSKYSTDFGETFTTFDTLAPTQSYNYTKTQAIIAVGDKWVALNGTNTSINKLQIAYGTGSASYSGYFELNVPASYDFTTTSQYITLYRVPKTTWVRVLAYSGTSNTFAYYDFDLSAPPANGSTVSNASTEQLSWDSSAAYSTVAIRDNYAYWGGGLSTGSYSRAYVVFHFKQGLGVSLNGITSDSRLDGKYDLYTNPEQYLWDTIALPNSFWGIGAYGRINVYQSGNQQIADAFRVTLSKNTASGLIPALDTAKTVGTDSPFVGDVGSDGKAVVLPDGSIYKMAQSPHRTQAKVVSIYESAGI